MATSFTQGDYSYYIDDEQQEVHATVVDTGKQSYENIPSSVTYNGTTYSVTDLNSCFFNCRNFTTPPTIPNTVTNMEECFAYCKALESIPYIPSSVIYMHDCFLECSSLSGNAVVANIPQDEGYFSNRIFPTGEDNIIFIIPDNLGSAGETKWRAIAEYSRNLHYYGDDVALSIEELSVKRVASKRSRVEDRGGSSSYVRMVLRHGGYVPIGYEQELSYGTMINNSSAQPVVDWSEISEEGVTEAWFDPPMSKDSQYAVTVTDNFQNSSTMVAELAKAFALFDSYHGNDGEGITIGTVAEKPGLNIAMDANFDGDVTMGNMMFQPVYMTDDHTEAGYVPSNDSCMVYDSTDNHLYYYANGNYTQVI